MSPTTVSGYDGSTIDVYIEGISKTSSGGASVTATFTPQSGANNSGTSKDKIQLTVYGIESVTWKKAKSGNPDIGDDKDLDRRIFPGAKDVGDSTDRSTAIAVVALTPALYGIDVYLDSYDIDDPTATGTPLDDDPSSPQPADPNYFDNRGFVDGESDGGFPNGGEPLTVTTGSDGKAEGEFSVAMQPGDNYRVVAATTSSQFNKVSALHPDSQGRVFHRDDSSLEVTEGGPATAVASPALTVWRKLHLEVDSMGSPPSGTAFDSDDQSVSDVPDPDTTLFDKSFKDAYVDVVFDTGNENSDADWDYHLENESERETQGKNNRSTTTTEKDEFWVGYIQGAYEPNTNESKK